MIYCCNARCVTIMPTGFHGLSSERVKSMVIQYFVYLHNTVIVWSLIQVMQTVNCSVMAVR